jgi:hypothetical protein
MAALKFQSVDGFAGGTLEFGDASYGVERGVEASAPGAGIIVPEAAAGGAAGFDAPGHCGPAFIADPPADAAALDAGRREEEVEGALGERRIWIWGRHGCTEVVPTERW